MNLDEYYISKPTIEAVGVFTILWCQFEQYKFNTNASTPKIREYANTFDLSVDLKALVLALAVKRESNIYLGTSDPERLRDRIYSAENRGKAEDVQAVLDFLDGFSKQLNFTGCLLYIQRIRNNLFHGLKDIYTLDRQRKMINAISELIYYLLNKDNNPELSALEPSDLKVIAKYGTSEMQYQLAVQIENEHRYSVFEAAHDLPVMLLKSAAEANHRDAQILLGDHYRGVNYKAALKWYRAAENNRHPDAHKKIVLCQLRYGTLTADNIEWFEQQFIQGDIRVGMWLGDYYGRKKKWDEAVEWYSKVYESAHTDSLKARAQRSIESVHSLRESDQ